jgi:hypothetical protein
MQKKSDKGAGSNQRNLEGEGSYGATRNYNKHLARALADRRSIERGAEAARKAVEGPEGPALREAEKRGKAGPRRPGKSAAASRR